MARPRTFDVDVALETALGVFWEHGYDSTSISDLKKAMGIETSSLYKAFGSKKELYEQALTRYLDRGRAMYAQTVDEAPSPLKGIERILEDAIASATEGARRGCFAINCAIDRAPQDKDVQKILRGHDRALIKLLAERVASAQAAGQVSPKPDATSVARFLLAMIGGLQVQGRGGTAKAPLLEALQVALRGLKP